MPSSLVSLSRWAPFFTSQCLSFLYILALACEPVHSDLWLSRGIVSSRAFLHSVLCAQSASQQCVHFSLQWPVAVSSIEPLSWVSICIACRIMLQWHFRYVPRRVIVKGWCCVRGNLYVTRPLVLSFDVPKLHHEHFAVLLQQLTWLYDFYLYRYSLIYLLFCCLTVDFPFYIVVLFQWVFLFSAYVYMQPHRSIYLREFISIYEYM